MIVQSAVLERRGLAGKLPAVRVEGLEEGIEAGLTTRERDFRFSRRGEDPAVARAYGELEEFAAGFGGWVRVHQVHGARVVRWAGAELPEADGVTLAEGDGLVTAPGDAGTRGAGSRRQAARLLTVTVADCVPVFLTWPGGYGLLHAGWRGTAAGVLEAGLAATGVPMERVRVHLGPAIGGCCYEVGPEVAEAVYRTRGGPPAGEAEGALRRGRGDRWLLDLRSSLRARAAAVGVEADRVSASACCTACGEGFHSFRARGERSVRSVMLAFIGARV